MNKSEQINELAAALAKAQSQFPPIERNRTVKVKTRDGAAYEFSYATLDSIIEATRKPLTDAGLAVIQHVVENAVATTLMHASGQWVSTHTPIVIEREGNQALGSAISYGRRNGLVALLNLCADQDDDGNHADGNRVQEAPKPKRAAPKKDIVWKEATSSTAHMRADLLALIEEVGGAGAGELLRELLEKAGLKSLDEMEGKDFPRAVAWVEKHRKEVV